MRIADNDTRRKIIDSGELVSYCERYGMEVQDEIRVNQIIENPLFENNASGWTLPGNVTISDAIITTFSQANCFIRQYRQCVAGHKYLISYEIIKIDDGVTRYCGYSVFNSAKYGGMEIQPYWKRYSEILTAVSGNEIAIFYNGSETGTSVRKPILRDLTSLGLADKSLEWLQTNRPDLFQNLDYIPETKTIKSVVRRIK